MVQPSVMSTNSNDTGEHPGHTTVPVAASASVTAFQPQPEFIRLPIKGLCPFTGLSRSKIYTLILPHEDNDFRPPVASVSLRKTGQLKGTRLVVLESLLAYLRHEVEVFQRSIRKASEE